MRMSEVRWILFVLVVLPGMESSSLAERLVDAESVVAYVNSCRKPNGAFGPVDQEYTDAAWNYPAVHSLRLLGAEISDHEQVLQHGLGYPRGHAGYGHWLAYHQAMARWLLNDRPTASARSPVRLVHQGFDVRYYGSPFGTGGDTFFKTDGESSWRSFQSETQPGYYNLSSLFYLLAALSADGRDVANREELVDFIRSRQAPNGGFVDVRTEEGRPEDTDTHVAHTYHAVASLKLLGADVPHADQCVVYLRRCQTPARSRRLSGFGHGGYLFDPDVQRPGNYPDVYYTFAALQALSLLNSEPADLPACTSWLLSLQNHDGGFGDRPGWRSRLYSTYYAVHSLGLIAQMTRPASNSPVAPDEVLTELAGTRWEGQANQLIPSRAVAVPHDAPPVDSSLRIHQALFKTPVVSPEDLHGLKQRGFSLLAMKTDDFTAAERLLNTDLVSNGTMTVVLCPEAYPHRLRRFGGAVLHHVGNFTLNPRWSGTERAVWQAADKAGQKGLAWADYQQQVLRPLIGLGSLCYPEQDFEMEYALSAYDDGLYGNGGYNALQVGFNWSPRDFVRVFPWRERYTDKLPVIADADAHGDLAKWSPQLDHVRYLLIAKSASYADFLDAATDGRVVCVVVNADSPGVSYYGPAPAVQFAKQREGEWKWW